MAHFGMRKDETESIAREWSIELYATPDAKTFDGDMTSKRFSNPVAFHISQTSHDVVAYLFSEEKDPVIPSSIDDLIRLTALQQARPSDAFASFFKLRSIVFSRIGKGAYNDKALQQISDRIDNCMLYAMDCYTKFREQVMQLRIDELKRSVGAFERRSTRRQQQMGA